MKKAIALFTIVILTSIALPASAQLRFGVKGGVNISSVHLSNLPDNLSSSNVTGFHVGPMIEASIPLLGVGFDAALLYTQKGMEVRSKSGSESIKIDYIDFPVHLKWKFGIPIVKGYIATGPYVGFKVNSDKFWDIPGETVDVIKAKTFGFGWDFGAGVEVFNHLQVGLNYGLGLTDNYKIGDKSGGKNRGWMVTAAIMF